MGKQKLILESAYNEITNQEFQKILQLKKEGNPSNNEAILHLYENINIRQTMIQPVLPIYLKKEYRNADIKIVNIDNELADAKNTTADYLYVKANKYLATGNKYDARDAYYLYYKIYGIFKDYKDVNQKIDTAKITGTNRVLLDYKNNSNQILPKDIMNELLNIELSSLNTEWAVFTNRVGKETIDNVVVINLNQVMIGPEQVNDRNFTEQSKIQDGFVYDYDSAGRIKKDVNGREIKIKRFKDVFAMVKEVIQHKEGYLEGSFDIVNYNTVEKYYTEPFKNNLVFHHESASFIGDSRALSDRTRANSTSRFIPFPMNENMIFDGIKMIKSNLKTMILRNKNSVEK